MRAPSCDAAPVARRSKRASGGSSAMRARPSAGHHVRFSRRDHTFASHTVPLHGCACRHSRRLLSPAIHSARSRCALQVAVLTWTFCLCVCRCGQALRGRLRPARTPYGIHARRHLPHWHCRAHPRYRRCHRRRHHGRIRHRGRHLRHRPCCCLLVCRRVGERRSLRHSLRVHRPHERQQPSPDHWK